MLGPFAQPSRMQASVIEIVALIAIIAIVGWFFVKPQAAALSSYQAELELAQSEYENIEDAKVALAELLQKLKSSSNDVSLVDEALPLHSRPTQLEVLLDGLVNASGMRIVEMSFQPVETSIAAGNKTVLDNSYGVTRKIETTNFNLSVSGNIDQFRNLLQLIETNGRVVDIINLDMLNDQGNAVFKLKLKAYSYVP